jgi:hypothetical protein
MRAIAPESSASSVGTSASVNVVETTSFGLLEELIRDLDLVRTRVQAHQRVHEPLQRVLRLDDLGRRSALERVRLVVDDERVLPFAPEDVEAAANDDAVVLERERPLGPSAWQARPSVLRGRTRSRRRQDVATRSSSSEDTSAYHPRTVPSELFSRWSDRIVESDVLEEPMDGVADLVRGQPPASVRARGSSLARREPENALGEIAVGAALEERECAVRQSPNVVRLRRRNLRERRKLDAEPRTGGRELAEERELQLVVGSCLGLGGALLGAWLVPIDRENETRFVALQLDRRVARLDDRCRWPRADRAPSRSASIGRRCARDRSPPRR